MIIKDTKIEITTTTGFMRTYLYSPDEPGRPERKRPGLILYSEIFQQTLPVKRLALQFASMGYIVAVPEVYHSHELPGCVLGYDEAGKNRGNELKKIITMAEFDADILATTETLQAYPACNGKLGAVGICLGGHLAYRAALLPQILATACFYPTDLHSGTLGKGDHADSLTRAKEIKGEMLMVFGKQDPHVPLEGRQTIYKALETAGVWFTWHEFNAAHAFLRDEGERYDPAVGKLCISLASDLFQRNL